MKEKKKKKKNKKEFVIFEQIMRKKRLKLSGKLSEK